MRAIVYHGPRDFRFESIPDPKLESASDAIVRVTRAAICGSDLHLWKGGVPVAAPGFSVGHEFVGVVEEAGSAVASVTPGQRVLVSCTVGCGRCELCRRGLYSGCPVATQGGTRGNVFGFSNDLPGGQAEAVRVPLADANALAVPDALSDEQALFLTDILPTAAMGAEWAEIGPGDRVVVFGCGPVGSLARRCARLRGAARVIAVDPDPGRLARARAEGCDTIAPDHEDVVARVLELTGGGADAVIEAVGKPDLVNQAVLVARPGGRVAVIGVIPASFEIPWPLVFFKNLTIRSGLVNPQVHAARLLALLESGRLDPTDLITHRLPLADAVRGYEVFANHREDALKVVLAP
jgi:2-desacetyl-2-hydroxyethyl bacteriochlorophyllide A dehydrogenase